MKPGLMLVGWRSGKNYMAACLSVAHFLRDCGNYQRGQHDCWQDRCEGCLFSSIGGMDSRGHPKAPYYIQSQDAGAYLRGYEQMAEVLWGPDWRTCEFSWKPVMVINSKEKSQQTDSV